MVKQCVLGLLPSCEFRQKAKGNSLDAINVTHIEPFERR